MLELVQLAQIGLYWRQTRRPMTSLRIVSHVAPRPHFLNGPKRGLFSVTSHRRNHTTGHKAGRGW